MIMPLLRDAGGQPQGFLSILRDRTDVQAAIERRELLMAEQSHRINNSFMIAQAIAVQTRRYTETAAEFSTAFRGRLAALARSNDVLTRADWHDTKLRDIIESALAAPNGEPGRVTLQGPSVQLGADLAMAVSLSFHELATNALKYVRCPPRQGRSRYRGSSAEPSRIAPRSRLFGASVAGPR